VYRNTGINSLRAWHGTQYYLQNIIKYINLFNRTGHILSILFIARTHSPTDSLPGNARQAKTRQPLKTIDHRATLRLDAVPFEAMSRVPVKCLLRTPRGSRSCRCRHDQRFEFESSPDSDLAATGSGLYHPAASRSRGHWLLPLFLDEQTFHRCRDQCRRHVSRVLWLA
jgi:hypothetical protein